MPTLREIIAGPWRAVLVLGVTQIIAWGAIFYPPVLTVPLIAVIVGVRRAVAGSAGYGRAGLVAVGSALVFGALVFVATWASTIQVAR